ncbi:hypothetical protein BT96DRAFT_1009100 [Gymnopus androsaceus JB14]|uniref:Uncharacterized protein n=1 Tax=Gymnopus androsaceus JB14 TaxID=1447944 RepID=A0A6A4GDH7_9AGAR|nr:hypothetical protein BT96DRAFT_1009100 [Gymnopus androsaceus JB14]
MSSVARHRSSRGRRKALQRKARDEKKKYLKEIEGLQVTLEENSRVISVLEPENSKLCLAVTKLEEKLSVSSATVSTLRKQISSLRKTIYALEKQVERLKSSLATSRMELKKLSVWDPTKKGIYKASARKLFHDLERAGCRNHDLAVKLCAAAFGIRVKRVMSMRTGGRCVREGGIYGLMQLGCEIKNVPSFGEGSDGTTVRGVTQESRLITVSVPSYEPGVDDTDQSTWNCDAFC